MPLILMIIQSYSDVNILLSVCRLHESHSLGHLKSTRRRCLLAYCTAARNDFEQVNRHVGQAAERSI